MAEYIEREAAKRAIMSQYLSRVNKTKYADLIDAIPAADVQPVRHGRWKRGDRPTYGGFKCSLCKKNTVDYKPPYCPNCGAKMDGEADAQER